MPYYYDITLSVFQRGGGPLIFCSRRGTESHRTTDRTGATFYFRLRVVLVVESEKKGFTSLLIQLWGSVTVAVRNSLKHFMLIAGLSENISILSFSYKHFHAFRTDNNVYMDVPKKIYILTEGDE